MRGAVCVSIGVMKIKEISARKILDSAGNWTIETKVELKDGASGVASVPSGVSVSGWEAKTVSADKAVKNVQDVVVGALQGRSPCNQATVDKTLIELDGTSDKRRLGANTILSVSLAFCRAAAKSSDLPLFRHLAKTFQLTRFARFRLSPKTPSSFKLPRLMVLLFEGGKHGSGKLCAQEFMAIAKDVKQGLKLYKIAWEHLQKSGESLSVGLEGGFTPDIDDREAVEVLNYILGGNPLALDVAFDSCENKNLNYQKFLGKLNVRSIEDPFGADDWDTWVEFTKGWSSQALVVADDLVATSPERLKEAIERHAANAVIVKPNQIGTLSETLEVVRLAKFAGWKIVVSHRADETNDDFIADLAVGVGADYVKFGGFARGERLAKYNRLLEIQNGLK